MKNTTSFRFLLVSRLLLVGLALTGAFSPGLHAALFTVNTTDDRTDFNPGNGVCCDRSLINGECPQGHCSLRAAIQESNANPGVDNINVPPGFYLLTHVNPNTGLVEPLKITTDIVIAAQGTGLAQINGGSKTQILNIINGNVQIIGLSFEGGRNDITNGGGFGRSAGIFISGESSLFLYKSEVANNRGGTGGVGIWNDGDLTLWNCFLHGNEVTGTGGGVTGGGGAIVNSSAGQALIVATRVLNNVAIFGGGISNRGRLRMAGSTLSGNSASEGGAIINTGNFSINDTTIDHNHAGRSTEHPFNRWNGGGISNAGSEAVVGVHHSTIDHNDGAIRGGAIDNRDSGFVNVENSTISGNTSNRGGAIHNVGPVSFLGSWVNCTFSTITDNQATFRFFDEPTGVGGGIVNNAIVTISFTILAGNRVSPSTPSDPRYSPDCFSDNPGSMFLSGSLGGNVVGVVNEANCILLRQLPSDIVGTPAEPVVALLGPLSPNGGPTRTHELDQLSPGHDIADCPDVSFGEVDQRHFLRPGDVNCDAGAYELHGAIPP